MSNINVMLIIKSLKLNATHYFSSNTDSVPSKMSASKGSKYNLYKMIY